MNIHALLLLYMYTPRLFFEHFKRLYIPCTCSAEWELLALEGLVREEGLVMWSGVARGNRGSGDVPVSPKKYLDIICNVNRSFVTFVTI